ncbi:MAG: hypothetical protein MJ252_10425 [archaeon]|nr:hypothetical protein [archaeon]
MSYDIKENKTMFDKEIMDGVYCIISGMFYNYSDPLCLVGGNCSVCGINANGEDIFWTVLGGNAVCLELADVNGDKFNELIVGTDDYAIRFFQNESSIYEVNENTKIIIIKPVKGKDFLYGLENGTLGLYKNEERAWKIKEKGFVNGLLLQNSETEENSLIVSGWSTGKIRLSEISTGKLVSEIEVQNGISKLLLNNFTNAETDQIIAITENGEIFGYSLGTEVYEEAEDAPISSKAKGKELTEEEINFNKLTAQKAELLKEFEELEVKLANRAKINAQKDDLALPDDTQILIDLQSNNENKCADLIIEAQSKKELNNITIYNVILVSEQIYKGETYIKFPSKETNKLIVQIKTKKDMDINLHLKVLVGKSYFLSDFQVYEFNKIIPKYCFYILLREEISYKNELIQGISFPLSERVDRLILFIEKYFNLAKRELETFRQDETTFRIRFSSLRTEKILEISMKNQVISIFTEETELAGNILQDMSIYFNKPDIDSKINYSEVTKPYGEIVERIQRLDKERNQYNINMTEITTFIKDIFVRAEDNRLLGNFKTFKDYFNKINLKNLELLDEFEKRTQSYADLLNDLKQMNEIIQNFANLKAGKYKNQMVNKCRDCIRKKNYALLMRILSTGSEE